MSVPVGFNLKLKHYIGAWLSAILSLLFLILTIAYASRWIGVSRYRYLGSSRSHTILILRILSELTTTALGLTLAFTTERVQWRLIIRERGQPFLSFLGLSPGTGVFGLMRLLGRRGPFMASWRWWSVSRLALLAVLPVLNVVIFGNVHTRLTYHAEITKTGDFDMGMGDFNVSVAQNLAIVADPIIGMNFDEFLSDSRFAVEITPSPEDVVPCTLGISKSSKQTCNQVFYMPGTFGDFDLLSNRTLSHADLVVVQDMRGYQLDFHTVSGNPIDFDWKKDCGVYGNEKVAFQICFLDNQGRIAIKINACQNATDINQFNCLEDTEWRGLPGFSSTMKIDSRLGTVGFSRLNSTIQTYELADDIQTTNITAAQLLAAFHGFFTGKSPGEDEDVPSEYSDLINSLLGIVDPSAIKIKMGPIFIGVYFGMGLTMYGSDNIAAHSAIGLYSLVAKILWWCSTPLARYVPAIGTVLPNTTRDFEYQVQTSFGETGQATYSLATSTYELVVSPSTIIAYGVLGGLVLLFCMLALIVSMRVTNDTNCLPVTTAFPDLDNRRLQFGYLDHIPWEEQVDINDEQFLKGVVRPN